MVEPVGGVADVVSKSAAAKPKYNANEFFLFVVPV